MKYTEFKEAIRVALDNNPAGLTWVELRELTGLPYRQPCPTWVRQLEQELGLTREKSTGRALIWKRHYS